MAKVPFNDITPPERRSIRNIPIPSGSRRKNAVKPEVSPKTEVFDQNREAENIDKKPKSPYEYYYSAKHDQFGVGGFKSKKKLIFGGAAAVAILIFIVSMMTVFASANVVVVPKSQVVKVALKTAATVESGENSLRYEVVKLSKSKEIPLAATGEEMVERKASGKIMVYNNYSSEPQRLIVRTRFESPGGLIYRIPESIMVPGKTPNGPGSIEVTVYADEAGEKYNIKKADFTIPGFENDPGRFKGFYGRSVADMEGGFIGKMKTVKEDEKEKALAALDAEMRGLLEAEIIATLPENMALLSGALIHESRELPQREESSSVILGEEATLYAMLLDEKDLSDLIIGEYISTHPDWSNVKAEVGNFTRLSLSGEVKAALAGEGIDLEIGGEALVVASIDTKEVGERLTGVSREGASSILDEFQGISSMKATLRPIWKRTFPENPSKIRVEASIEEAE